MKDFVTIDELSSPVNYLKIDLFISRFNEIMLQKKNVMNSAFDKCPDLNELEFEKVVEKAKENGYDLTRVKDEYSVIIYTIVSHKYKQKNNNTENKESQNNTKNDQPIQGNLF